MSSSPLPIPTYLQGGKYTQMQVIKHFLGQPLPKAPKALNDVVFVGLDVEWYESTPGSLTEIGISILDSKNIKSGMDVWEILKSMKAQHARIKPHAHMVNSVLCPGRPDMFHFGTTKFVEMDEGAQALTEAFCHRDENDKLRPVIFVGHAVDNDIEQIKEHFGLDLNALGIIVATIDSQKLAAEAGLGHPCGRAISLRDLIGKFGIKEKFLHTGGNDIVYTTIATFLCATPERSRPCATNQMNIDALKVLLPQTPQPTWGIEVFCTRCDATTHFEANCTVAVCTKCSSSTTLGALAHTHKTEKCTFQEIVIRKRLSMRGVVIPCEKCVQNPDPRRWKKANTHLTQDCVYNN